jgi:hypothetical protein
MGSLVVFVIGLAGGVSLLSATQAPDAEALAARVAALKKALEDDQMRLRGYEWIETTIIRVKGEEKARRQHRVYHGADGALQKVPLGNPPPPPAQPSGRGGRLKQRVVENKKEEMQDYMERAAALVHSYVPPKPAQVQAARDGGRVNLSLPSPGRPRLEFRDYLQRADSMIIDIDAANDRLVALTVATYLDTPEDPVSLAVQFGALTDGTGYTRQSTLDAKAQGVTVVIENSGYRPLVR